MANDNTQNPGFIFAGRDPNGRPLENFDPKGIMDELEELNNKLKDIGNQNKSTIDTQGQRIRELTGGAVRVDVASTTGEIPQFMRNHLESMRNMGISPEDSTLIAAQLVDATRPSVVNPTANNAPSTPVQVAPNIQNTQNTQPQVEVKAEVKTEAIPEEKFKLTPEKKKQIRELPSNIKEVIYGQDEIIDEVVSVLKTALLGLSANKKKPRGAYLFAGPSGCGKTETVIQIANFLNIPVKKFSMAEYSEENDVKKLIGSPPGYIGYEDGGQLTNFVKEHPNGIILFDEIEKADEALGKILLGVLDDGKLTDNKGTEVSFTNTIFFATSNLGAEVEYVDHYNKEEKDEYRMQAIKGHFPPEVINRFDAIIQFFAVSPDVYAKIVSKVMKSLAKDFKNEHDIEFSYDKNIIDFIVKNSYDPAMGGRPAGRFMGKVLISGLVDKMFEDTMDGVEFIKLDLSEGGNIVFKNKEDVVIDEMENTKDLLSRYNKSRLTKDEQATVEEAKSLASKTPPADSSALPEAPKGAGEMALIELPAIVEKKSTRAKTHTAIEKDLAEGSGNAIVTKIANSRIKKRTEPRRG